MYGNIDKVREAFEKWLASSFDADANAFGAEYDKLTVGEAATGFYAGYKSAVDSISAIDPEAIRRECANSHDLYYDANVDCIEGPYTKEGAHAAIANAEKRP